MSARILPKALPLALAVLINGAQAQVPPPPTHHSHHDIRRSRTDTVATRPAQSPTSSSQGSGIAEAAPQDDPTRFFALDLIVPFFFNSNAQAAQGGTAAAETMPELRLTWSRRWDGLPLRFTALVDVAADRYANVPSAYSDQAYAEFRVQTESGNDDQEWQGFVSYSPWQSLYPFFSARNDLRHDFTLGMFKQFNFSRAMERVPTAGNTSDATTWSFSLEAAAQRRMEELGTASSALVIDAAVTYVHSPQWNLHAELDVTRRWYDGANGFRRQDWLFTPVVTLEYVPADGWGDRLGKPVIDLQFFFARQASNQSDARFHQWGTGPVFHTTWSF